jgi:hypothetical protein
MGMRARLFENGRACVCARAYARARLPARPVAWRGYDAAQVRLPIKPVALLRSKLQSVWPSGQPIAPAPTNRRPAAIRMHRPAAVAARLIRSYSRMP